MLRDPVSRIDTIWDGITRRHTLTNEDAAIRTKLADLAKAYDWSRLLKTLSKHRELVNTTRPEGHSLYAPLHQAAYSGAPLEVVHQLLRLGAWRTLRNAKRERPLDIARRKSQTVLLSILEPEYRVKVPLTVLSKIQAHFHTVIRMRANRMVEENALRLPELEPLLESNVEKIWFPVPGMYGGFCYWLAHAGPEVALISESWCRVIGGSGQRHEITEAGSKLVEEGFV